MLSKKGGILREQEKYLKTINLKGEIS